MASEMTFQIDPDVKSVLEFMQDRISADRLVAVAASLPDLAKLLWSHYPQQPCLPVTLEPDPAVKRQLHSQLQSAASVSCLG